jgi:ABC-type transport system involved in multi-copper enzyme maturation permease subunit
MNINWRRVRAIFRKELREFRHSGNILWGMAVLPLIFVTQPAIVIFGLSAQAATVLAHEHPLLYMLGIPAIVPAALASYAVVGERDQGTLEPVLTTPIRREELILGKALAAFVPSATIAYSIYALFLAAVALFAQTAVASTLLTWQVILPQVVFTPLLVAWAIWVGMAVSGRVKDVRTAQQLGVLASLPTFAVTALITFNVIHASLGLALGLGAALLVLDGVGWRVTAATFNRERLITSTR